MFTFNKCLVKSCPNDAVSIIDKNGKIADTKTYCINHIPNPAKIQADIYKYIREHDSITGLNVYGLSFKNLDISNKKFWGCNFMHCAFSKVHIEDCRIFMSIFDFSFLSDCMFLNITLQFSSFANCQISHSLFNDGEIIKNNFNGIQAKQSSFDNSNLYNSRFLCANIENTSFRNCNLVKTDFCISRLENVSFKLSETKVAVFDTAGSTTQKDLNGRERILMVEK